MAILNGVNVHPRPVSRRVDSVFYVSPEGVPFEAEQEYLLYRPIDPDDTNLVERQGSRIYPGHVVDGEVEPWPIVDEATYLDAKAIFDAQQAALEITITPEDEQEMAQFEVEIEEAIDAYAEGRATKEQELLVANPGIVRRLRERDTGNGGGRT